MIFRNNGSSIANQSVVGAINPNAGVNIEVSYDNFDVVGLDQERKRQYANDLLLQIEEKERKRREEAERKKREEMEEEARLQRERDELEKKQNDDYNRRKPKVTYTAPAVEKPVKILTNPKPKRNNLYNSLTENTLRFLRNRDLQLGDYNEGILEKLRMLNEDFVNNVNNLRGEIGNLHEMNNRNRLLKANFYKGVDDIRKGIGKRNREDDSETINIYRFRYSDNNDVGFLDKLEEGGRNYKWRYFEEEDYKNMMNSLWRRNASERKMSNYSNLSHSLTSNIPSLKEEGTIRTLWDH